VSEENLQYKDFVAIEKDGQGYVTLIQANTVKVNQVATETTLAVQKALEEMKIHSFDIPLGLVLQTPFLADYGPRINVHVYPVGTVRVKIIDNFESAGINQTRHSIYLSFDTNVRIVIPTKSGDALVATQVPLAETIIVGTVPTTYVSLPGGLIGSTSFK
jgi:sporulation protein YunB